MRQENFIDRSFQEKSQWLTLLSLMAVLGFYFVQALPPTADDVGPEHVGLFVAAVVFLIVLQVVGHVIIAVVDRRTGTDERDRLIALKGTRNGSLVLATGVFLALCAAVFTPGNFVFTDLLLDAWVLAQFVETGSRLRLYRRGA